MSGDTTTSSEVSSDTDLIADLAGHLEELRIVVHDLEISRPSTWLSFVALQLSVVLLLASLAAIAGPFLVPTIPQLLSTIAAFLAVALSYLAYAAYRRFSVDMERRRLHTAVLKRAVYLNDVAARLLRDVESQSSTAGDY